MLAAAALLVMVVVPAKADPAACDAIQNGFNAVASVPGYRQIMEVTRTGERLEGVVIGETVYMRVNDRWSRMRLKAGGRKGLIKNVINLASISDCRELRSEILPHGGRAKIYEYTMTPTRDVSGGDGKPIRQQVWIGIGDGLVHRQVGEDLRLSLSFDRVMPPIP